MDTATLIAECAAWLAIALTLVADLTGRGFRGRKTQGVAYRWMGAGLLVVCTGAVVRQFGEVRRWPAGQLLVIDALSLVLAVAGVACVITGVVATVRSRRVTRGASCGSG